MHHAILYIGNSLESSGLPSVYHTASPSVTHLMQDSFTIADARALKELIYQRPIEGSTAVFVIKSHTIASEAQQALLKILEEPPVHAQLFIVVPRLDSLLPTVRSRLLYEQVSVVSEEANPVFETFKALSLKERIETIAEKTKAKDLKWIEAILAGAESLVRSDQLRYKELAHEILLVRSYIASRGASKKMLLESLACSLP